MRRTVWIALSLALCVSFTACGSGGDDAAEGFSFGALEYALPFLPGLSSTEAPVFGFKNLSSVDVTISAGAYTSLGGLYPPGMIPVFIPALGETRVPLGAFTGGPSAGGWVGVDTSGAAAGLVVPYVDRFVAGGKRSAEKGLAFKDGPVWTTLSPFATSYELINHSGIAVTYDVTMYATDGSTSGPTPVVLADGESSRVAVVPGTVGLVTATPTTAGVLMSAISAQEGGVPVHSEYRYRNDADTGLDALNLAFDLEFGRDAPGFGNVHDFGVLLSNPTGSLETLTINAIYRDNGTAILSTPIFVPIDPFSTKFLATRTIDSYGLDLGGGETSPFEALFGDVSAAGSVTSFTLLVTAPDDIDVSARHYDRLFQTYCRLVHPRRLTTRVNVCNMPIQTTQAGSIRTYVDFMNPVGFEQTVFVRGFTPGGTEYILDSFTIPPFRRVRWSQDGTIYREDPFDLLLPPVPFMSFEFSSTGGLHYGARTEIKDTQGIFTNMVPIIVRNLAFE